MLIQHLLSSFYLTVPLLIGGLVHMVVIKKDLLPALCRPISRRLFGPNKTLRGLFVMPLGVGLGVFFCGLIEPAVADLLTVKITNFNPIFLSLALGLAYIIFELPNSFFKRRMGVPAGALPDRNRGFFFFLDHTDSLTGCFLVYALFFGGVPLALWLCVPVGILVHTGLNLSLWAIGVRREAF
jgi:CDP-diacylglycerol--serine O-phosphatidyltransferase